jgi:hypothetical protein
MMIYTPNKVNPIPKKVKALCIQIRLIRIQNPNEPNISQQVQMNSWTHQKVPPWVFLIDSEMRADSRGERSAMIKAIRNVMIMILANHDDLPRKM